MIESFTQENPEPKLDTYHSTDYHSSHEILPLTQWFLLKPMINKQSMNICPSFFNFCKGKKNHLRSSKDLKRTKKGQIKPNSPISTLNLMQHSWQENRLRTSSRPSQFGAVVILSEPGHEANGKESIWFDKRGKAQKKRGSCWWSLGEVSLHNVKKTKTANNMASL